MQRGPLAWGLLLVAVLAVAGAALALSLAAWRTASDLPDALSDSLSDGVVDSLVAAGFARQPLDRRDPLLAERTIVLTEGINEATARAVVEKLLLLDARDAHTPIDLFLSTQGGWFDAAFAIIAAIDRVRAPVNTIAIGGCYSAGALVLASGTGRRSADENSLISIHEALEAANGPDDPSVPLERARIERLLRARTRLPTSWFPLEDDREYYLTPEQALEYGLIDEIRHRAPPAAGGRGAGATP